MKVHIEGSIFLESDEMQFVVKEYSGKTDKDGREIYKTLGYFGSIASAIRFLVKLKLMRSTAATLQELAEDVKRIEQCIESKLTV